LRVLIDTNVFIDRENAHFISEPLQDLLRILSELKTEILLHPKSIDELRRNGAEDRRKIALSKVSAYRLLESPPDPSRDLAFLEKVGKPANPHDYVDNAILYSVYKEAVHFLITEDQGIHNKARKLGLADRVLSIREAAQVLGRSILDDRVHSPPALRNEYVYNLRIADPFFESLKREYQGFENWFRRISQEGRKCWVYFRVDSSIGALLIYKIEDEPIDSTPPLPKARRLKLSTFKVDEAGFKIGELFVKLSIEYAINNDIREIYLTHFIKASDSLVDLIGKYGFLKVSKKENGEDVFFKTLFPNRAQIKTLPPQEVAKNCWPNFCDGRIVRKFIIPIRPQYYDRLFIEHEGRQTEIIEHMGQFIIEGNTIEKAYLCHSGIRKVFPGDILLFYRSQDLKELKCLGVIEKVYTNLRDKDRIIKIVGKRTVYTIDEIAVIARKPTTVILFTWHFGLKRPLKLVKMKEMKILSAAPQSIVRISHEKYLRIKSEGALDERFTID
jgi:rRNA-processing protein FCF1